jgi:hypothetical protein
MAFFGDLGRFFNIETSEAARIGAQLAVGDIGGATLSGVKAIATPIPEGESRPSDVSGPPAGVDSPATLSRISQTGQLMPPAPSGTAEGFRGGFGMPQQAFIGGFGLPSIVGGATRLLSRPSVGGLVGGLGAGAVVDFFIDQFGQQRKLVITRKMQRDVKKLFMMSGGDFNMTSELYRMATGRSITGEQVVKIITKTFKNQGPYVTKAAVRKTRSTIRKMETLCDLKDRLCPPRRPAARRRMPAKSTTITNVR